MYWPSPGQLVIAFFANQFAFVVADRRVVAKRRESKVFPNALRLVVGLGRTAILLGLDLGVFYILTKIGLISGDLSGTFHGSGTEVTIHAAGLLGGFLAIFFATVWATRYLGL